MATSAETAFVTEWKIERDEMEALDAADTLLERMELDEDERRALVTIAESCRVVEQLQQDIEFSDYYSALLYAVNAGPARVRVLAFAQYFVRDFGRVLLILPYGSMKMGDTVGTFNVLQPAHADILFDVIVKGTAMSAFRTHGVVALLPAQHPPHMYHLARESQFVNLAKMEHHDRQTMWLEQAAKTIGLHVNDLRVTTVFKKDDDNVFHEHLSLGPAMSLRISVAEAAIAKMPMTLDMIGFSSHLTKYDPCSSLASKKMCATETAAGNPRHVSFHVDTHRDFQLSLQLSAPATPENKTIYTLSGTIVKQQQEDAVVLKKIFLNENADVTTIVGDKTEERKVVIYDPKEKAPITRLLVFLENVARQEVDESLNYHLRTFVCAQKEIALPAFLERYTKEVEGHFCYEPISSHLVHGVAAIEDSSLLWAISGVAAATAVTSAVPAAMKRMKQQLEAVKAAAATAAEGAAKKAAQPAAEVQAAGAAAAAKAEETTVVVAKEFKV